MSLILNGTTATDVYLNGVKCTEVYLNGTKVMEGIPTSGLIAYYKFENNGIDELGTYNLTGIGYYEAGRFGQCMYGDGSSGLYAFNTLLDEYSGSWSISIWVKQTSSSLRSSFVFGRFTNGNDQHNVRFISNDIIAFHSYESDATTLRQISTSGNNYLNNWVHIVAMLDGSTIRLYINGVNKGTATKTSSFPIKDIVRFARSEQLNYSDTRVDNIRIYNRALTASEVLALYNEA